MKVISLGHSVRIHVYHQKDKSITFFCQYFLLPVKRTKSCVAIIFFKDWEMFNSNSLISKVEKKQIYISVHLNNFPFNFLRKRKYEGSLFYGLTAV